MWNNVEIALGAISLFFKGIKECTYQEHWVLYRSIESLYCTPETNITPYVNWNLNTNLKKISLKVNSLGAHSVKHLTLDFG